MSRISLLGVPIDSVSMKEAVARLNELLNGSAQSHVATPNNEMLVEAHRNSAFRTVLQSTALNLPDSTGLMLAAKIAGQSLQERVPGVDCVQKLCRELGPEHSIFLLGAGDGVGVRVGEILKQKNPCLNIVGTYSGSPRDEDAVEIVRRINEAKPHLLLVAFGSPQQDLWIAEHLKEILSVKVAMGVGGTLDFIAGVQKRASRSMRIMGLEWLWRFIREPRRWRRMWNAVVVFPSLVLRYGKGRP